MGNMWCITGSAVRETWTSALWRRRLRAKWQMIGQALTQSIKSNRKSMDKVSQVQSMQQIFKKQDICSSLKPKCMLRVKEVGQEGCVTKWIKILRNLDLILLLQKPSSYLVLRCPSEKLRPRSFWTSAHIPEWYVSFQVQCSFNSTRLPFMAHSKSLLISTVRPVVVFSLLYWSWSTLPVFWDSPNLTMTLGLSFVWCFKMVANLKSCQKQTVGM